MSGRLQRFWRRARHVPGTVGKLLRYGRPKRALLFGPLSLGDDLLCTAVLREARLRAQPFAIFSARPELFEGNDDPTRVIPIDDYYVAALRLLGTRIIQPYYASADPAMPDRDIVPSSHIIAEMCRQAGVQGTVSLRPYLHLTDAERARGRIHSRQIAIQSTGAAAAVSYANKEWGAEKFAAVARLLAPDFKLVQIGSASDPALPVDNDLRGRTSLRETAAILASSDAFVGLEGFLAHLARAVECPSAIIFGGRARPDVFGYSANQNFYSPVPCAPCGLRNTCDYDRKCLKQITPDAVAAAVRELVARPRGVLPLDTADVR